MLDHRTALQEMLTEINTCIYRLKRVRSGTFVISATEVEEYLTMWTTRREALLHAIEKCGFVVEPHGDAEESARHEMAAKPI